MANPSSTVRITQFLILLNATIWLAFGILIGIGMHPSFTQPSVLRWGMAISSLLAAGFLTLLVVLLRRRNRIAYWVAVILLAGISIAGTLDEIGLADLAFVIATILALVLLLKDRNWYLRPV
jgi:hypothetical protein